MRQFFAAAHSCNTIQQMTQDRYRAQTVTRHKPAASPRALPLWATEGGKVSDCIAR